MRDIAVYERKGWISPLTKHHGFANFDLREQKKTKKANHDKINDKTKMRDAGIVANGSIVLQATSLEGNTVAESRVKNYGSSSTFSTPSNAK